jgi:hypothetical protein
LIPFIDRGRERSRHFFHHRTTRVCGQRVTNTG